jgi:protein-arginine kinase activator protein McsA
MEIKEIPKTQKNPKDYCCEICNFNTSHKNDYSKHLTTAKHKNMCLGNKMDTLGNQKTQKNPILFICSNCNKNYNTNSGLWKHKKGCNTSEDKQKDDLINYLIKENQEFKHLILEIVKKDTPVTNNSNNNNNTTSNSHNKTFNLQFFLNETCKDAMNIMDFVDSIKLQLTDLEKVGRIGFVEGISNIITSNLKALDVTQRPIHCTDNKREVLYIKDENKWEKEVDEKDKIRKAIKMVANKNIKILPKFKEVHPDCLKSESKYSDQYNKLVIESFGGSGDNDLEKEDKIIKNIAKGVIIEK